jgi:hypothetical protein
MADDRERLGSWPDALNAWLRDSASEQPPQWLRELETLLPPDVASHVARWLRDAQARDLGTWLDRNGSRRGLEGQLDRTLKTALGVWLNESTHSTDLRGQLEGAVREAVREWLDKPADEPAYPRLSPKAAWRTGLSPTAARIESPFGPRPDVAEEQPEGGFERKVNLDALIESRIDSLPE